MLLLLKYFLIPLRHRFRKQTTCSLEVYTIIIYKEVFPMKHPNIILIMTDQLRGDCLGIAGHPDVKTPYLDTLASRGVSFDHAYSACPSCIAARAALHTGMTPEHHQRVGYED